MPGPRPPEIVLSAEARAALERLARAHTTGQQLAVRARIVLLAAEGLPNAEIARRTGTIQPTVVGWRGRYETGGIPALEDLPRSGRPVEVDEVAVVVVVVTTLADGGRPPEHLGVTHWSAPLVGQGADERVRDGRPDLAQMELAALAGGDLQVLHRP